MTENKSEVVMSIPNAGIESHDPNEVAAAAKSPPLHCASPEIRFNNPSPNMPQESITPKTPLMKENEAETIYKKVEFTRKRRYKRLKTRVLIELFVFVCILTNLIASLTVPKLKKTTLWGVEVWRWYVIFMVTFSGISITRWFMRIVVFLIEMNFLLRKKVLYYAHGLKRSVQVFIWLGLVLFTWVLLVKPRVRRSELAKNVMDVVTPTLFSLFIGAFFWMLKTLLIKILASHFNVKSLFDRIQESIFHQYVLQTLSGPPLPEMAEKVVRSPSIHHSGTKKEVIDMEKLHWLKREKVSAWTIKALVDMVTKAGLSIISSPLDETFDGEETEQTDKEITNEMEAIAAAYFIFRNVACPGCQYIDEGDLLRFMIREEVDLVFLLLARVETGQIDRKSLTDWVVKVYHDRKALAHTLNDTKAAVKQFNRLVNGILIVVIIILWLLMMGFATEKVNVFLSSMLVLVAFMFGNTCKNVFEAIIFVFVMDPFDVGDRCVVDGVELLVEEMNIMTTVFLKLNNEKVYYPNSVLATKPISNYYRSPDMGDSVEFSIDFLTSAEKIGALKEKIKRYLERNPRYWHPNHNLVVKDIENANTINMGLFVNHTMNFQDFGQKNRRRSKLVMEIKKILEELNIRHDLVPNDEQ